MQVSFFTAFTDRSSARYARHGANPPARVTRAPKAVSIGLVSQLLFLPIVGFLVAAIMPMQPEIAVGLMVLALCPKGASSNMITYLAKGDVALSVTLTALSSAITVFTIPIFANHTLQYFVGQNAAIALPIRQTMLQIFAIAHCANWFGNVDKAASQLSLPTREEREPSCYCLPRFNYLGNYHS